MSGISKEGYLLKNGSKYKSNYFMIQSNLFLRYKSKPGKTGKLPKETIDLISTDINSSTLYKFCISIRNTNTNKTLFVCANDQQDSQDWIFALKKASSNFNPHNSQQQLDKPPIAAVNTITITQQHIQPQQQPPAYSQQQPMYNQQQHHPQQQPQSKVIPSSSPFPSSYYQQQPVVQQPTYFTQVVKSNINPVDFYQYKTSVSNTSSSNLIITQQQTHTIPQQHLPPQQQPKPQQPIQPPQQFQSQQYYQQSTQQSTQQQYSQSPPPSYQHYQPPQQQYNPQQPPPQSQQQTTQHQEYHQQTSINQPDFQQYSQYKNYTMSSQQLPTDHQPYSRPYSSYSQYASIPSLNSTPL